MMPQSHAIPENFRCSITLQIMAEPVIALDGFTYEKEAIQMHLKRYGTSPTTGVPLQDMLIPNNDKLSTISEFLGNHPELYEGDEIYLPESWVQQFVAAIKQNQLQVVQRWVAKDKRLLTMKLECDNTALYLGCEFGSPELVDVLLKALKRENQPILSDVRGFKLEHLNVLLRRALEQGNYTECELLLTLGADIEQPAASTQDTLLHQMVTSGNEPAVIWLVGYKADLEARNKEKNTPLLLSVIHAHRRITALLLKNNASLKAENKDEKTAFYMAIEKRDAEIEALLLTYDANPVVGFAGFRFKDLPELAFRTAVKAKHRAVITLLLEAAIQERKNAQEKSEINSGKPQELKDAATKTHAPAAKQPLQKKSNATEKKHSVPTLLSDKVVSSKKTDSLIQAIINNDQIEVFRLLNLNKKTPGREVFDEVDSEYKGGPVYWAACYNHVHFISPLVKAGADVNKCDKYEATPLAVAAAQGHIEAIITLLAEGADVNRPNDEGWTPIYAAARNGRAEAIAHLKAAGANVNMPAKEGINPMFIAAAMGHAGVITALHNVGADVNSVNHAGWTPMHIAAQGGHVKAIFALVGAGAALDIQNSEGGTPLLVATFNARLKAIDTLLELGADANKRADLGTPLEFARLSKNLGRKEYGKIVELLELHHKKYPNGVKQVSVRGQKSALSVRTNSVSEEKNPSQNNESASKSSGIIEAVQQNNQAVFFKLLNSERSAFEKRIIDEVDAEHGGNALYWAARQGHTHFINPLIKAGVDVNEHTREGRVTPVFIAAQNGRASVIPLLFKAGANINMPDALGKTPLYVAAENGHTETVNALISEGATVDMSAHDGRTPIYIAAQKGHTSIISALVAAGAKIDKAKKDGATPLLVAVYNGYLEAASVLLEAGADANIKTGWGTILDIAKKGKKVGHSKIIKLLEAHFMQYPASIKSIKDSFRGQCEKKTQIQQSHADGAERLLGSPNSLTFSSQAFPLSMHVKSIETTSNMGSKDIAEFLMLVAEGEQDKAEAMLRRDPALALTSGNVTDLSKRTFKGITGFQYAVWALDWHMWSMIKKYLPDEAASAQAQGFEKDPWVKSHGVHAQFLLENLIKALKPVINLCYANEDSGLFGPELNSDWVQQVNTAWIKEVGGAQRLLPVHVINEYCHPERPLFPTPDFREAKVLPRTRRGNAWEWFAALSSGCAWGRNGGEQAHAWPGESAAYSVFSYDLDPDSIQELSNTRVAQREELITQLNSRSIQREAVPPVEKLDVLEQKNSSEFMLPLFQVSIEPISRANTNDLPVFLKFIAEGEQEKAEVMLKSNAALALISGDVTDLSGRTFVGITVFQYAAWALDWHMWTMIRKYLSIEDAKLQAQGFKTGSWVKEHGVNAEKLLDNLIQAYQTSISFDKASKRAEYCAALKQIGGVQFLLPAHVVNEYCHPVRPFYPIPNFKDDIVLPRSRATDTGDWFTFFYNRNKENYNLICRSTRAKATVGNRLVCLPWHGKQQCEASETDYESICVLSKSRLAQYKELVTELISEKGLELEAKKGVVSNAI